MPIQEHAMLRNHELDDEWMVLASLIPVAHKSNSIYIIPLVLIFEPINIPAFLQANQARLLLLATRVLINIANKLFFFSLLCL